jgi:hypothetical protein
MKTISLLVFLAVLSTGMMAQSHWEGCYKSSLGGGGMWKGAKISAITDQLFSVELASNSGTWDLQERLIAYESRPNTLEIAYEGKEGMYLMMMGPGVYRHEKANNGRQTTMEKCPCEEALKWKKK